MSAPQDPQEANGLHLLVPGAGAVGGTSPPIKNLLSGDTNKSPRDPFCTVSAPQGPKEAHGLLGWTVEHKCFTISPGILWDYPHIYGRLLAKKYVACYLIKFLAQLVCSCGT